ncbi:MAG: hypothetical protein GEU80_03005 [Dehalococcoidia bacterium]|nr:hypothetical protein [Dehalococcoidia bacterium]
MNAQGGDPDFDEYADSFQMSVNAYGVSLLFQRSPGVPSNPGQVIHEPLGVVRMSLEHAKVMSMIMRRQLKKFENESGFKVAIRREVLNNLQLSEEDWDKI